MNCIDAIEGSAKSIIEKLHEVFVDTSLDDTEYILNVKAVIMGIGEFIRSNKAITSDPETLEHVLYEFSKKIWFSQLLQRQKKESGTEDSEKAGSEIKEYYDYYFDYLYAHGKYPQ